MITQGENLAEVLTQAELLHDQAAVENAVASMAQDINLQLANKHPIVLTVLVGGIVVTGQLLPKLDFPLQLDYIHATRYQGNTHGDELVWRATPSLSLQGRNILIVDDILDVGHTLEGIINYCNAQQAAKVYTAVLVDKQRARAQGCLSKADFTGLEVDSRYVFGYGMDYHEGLRNAPGIYALKNNKEHGNGD